MKCEHIKLGDHQVIVCRGGKRKPDRCTKCGAPAGLLCDWKVDSYHTCDAPICAKCTHSPDAGKDLCPRHAEIWAKHPENPKNRGASP